MNDPRIEDIRKDPKVGRGNCTTIDEATTDSELVIALDEAGVTTVEEAVAWAIEDEGLQIDNALNHRWGDDSELDTGK